MSKISKMSAEKEPIWIFILIPLQKLWTIDNFNHQMFIAFMIGVSIHCYLLMFCVIG